jgi:general secretion pathway protein N
MKNPFLLALASFVLFIIFLLAKLPATQVIPRLPLPDKLSISQVSGTIWSGHADQVIYNGLQVLDVDWELGVLPLLLGKASLYIDAGSIRDTDQIAIKGNISIGSKGLSSTDTQVYAPTPLLLAQLQLPLPVDASGRVLVEIDELDHPREGCKTLSGKGQWINGAVTVVGFDQELSLGSYAADLKCDNGPIQLTVAPDNTLSLSGTAAIDNTGQFSAEGKFKVPSDFPKEMRDAAALFSPPDAQGFHTVKL